MGTSMLRQSVPDLDRVVVDWRQRAAVARAASRSADSEQERCVQIGMAAIWTSAANELAAIRAAAPALPFERDVAYMPVPRCESCARWTRKTGRGGTCGLACDDDVVPIPVLVTAGPLLTREDFGCVQWKERP